LRPVQERRTVIQWPTSTSSLTTTPEYADEPDAEDDDPEIADVVDVKNPDHHAVTTTPLHPRKP
jgi:hypothetical protein